MTCQLDFRIQEIRARVNSLNFDHDVDRDAIFFPNNDEKHLREVIGKKANVAGVYIVYGKNNDQTQEHLLYIGKSGTIAQDGSIGDQKIRKRLLNVRAIRADKTKIKGNEYFRMVLNGEISGVGQWDVLRIKWIETYRKPEGIPPFLAEAQLLAAYLSDTGKLPPLNQKA
jgi:hypothetical protein